MGVWLLLNFNETLEINEKITENQGVIHTKLLISHFIIVLEYQIEYQSTAKKWYSYLMGCNEINIIWMYNEKLRKE